MISKLVTIHLTSLLSGPVYNTDHSHKFNEIEKRIEGLKSLQGPHYDGIDREHG